MLKNSINLSFIIIYFSFFLIFQGCTGSWKIVNQNGPWINENEQAKTAKRWHSYYGSSSVEWESVWIINRFKSYDHHEIAENAVGFLMDIGFCDDWPEQGDGWDRKIAPYRFFIVSLNPAITVMTPKNIPYEKGNLLLSLRGGTIYSTIVSNHIEYGVFLPTLDGAMWYSHDLNIKPQAIPFSRIIEFPKFKLKFDQYKNVWKVKRIDK